MSEELKSVLKDLHGVTNRLSITGEGVSGNLTDGWIVDVSNSGGPAPEPTPP